MPSDVLVSYLFRQVGVLHVYSRLHTARGALANRESNAFHARNVDFKQKRVMRTRSRNHRRHLHVCNGRLIAKGANVVFEFAAMSSMLQSQQLKAFVTMGTSPPSDSASACCLTLQQ